MLAEREDVLQRTYQPWHLGSTEAWPKPKVHYTTDGSEAVRILATMKGPLAFDMEWTVSTKRGVEKTTDVLQFADSRTCLVFQLQKPKVIPRGVIDLLQDPKRIKLGVNIRGDALKLARDFNRQSDRAKHIHVAGMLELSTLAKTVDPDRCVWHPAPR